MSLATIESEARRGRSKPWPLAGAGAPDLRFLCLVVLLLGFLWSGAVQLHPPIGWVDPGLYVYWFLHPAENFALRGGDYHGSRVPFILAGTLSYRLFEPVLAQAMLVSAFYIAGLFAIHRIAAFTLPGFALRAAVVCLIGLNPIWIASLARGYVDGPAIVLGLASLACVMRRNEPAGLVGHVAAGALLLLAFFTHPFAGGLAALSVLGFVLVRQASVMARGLALLCLGLGAVLAFVLCGLGASAIGLPFFFPQMSLARIGQALVTTAPSPFLRPFALWAGEAQRLALLPLTMILLAAGIRGMRLRSLDTAGRDRLALACAALLPLLALLATLPLWSSFVLQFDFYASYVWLPLVPALVLFVARVTGPGPARSVALGLAALAACGVVLALMLPLSLRAERLFGQFAWGLVLVTLGLGLLGLLLRRKPAALLAMGAGLALAGAANRDTVTALRLRDAPDLAAQHAGMRELHRFLAEHAAASGPYLVWLSRDRFAAQRDLPESQIRELSFAGTSFRLNALDSLAASLGWDIASLGFNMPNPELDPAGLRRLAGFAARHATFIALCGEAADCAEGEDALRELGMEIRPLGSRMLQRPGLPAVTVRLARLGSPEPDAEPASAQWLAILRRLAANDAWLMAHGGTPDDTNQRAMRREPSALAFQPGSVELWAVECEPPGAVRGCRVWYSEAGGRLVSRRLILQRVGRFNWLINATPAQRPAEITDAMAPHLQDMLHYSTSQPGRYVSWTSPSPAPAFHDARAAILDPTLARLREAGPATILTEWRDNLPRPDAEVLARMAELGRENLTWLGFCAEAAACEEMLRALREFGLRITPGPQGALAGADQPRATLRIARLTTPGRLNAPEREQIAAILERLQRVDAGSPGQSLTPQARAEASPPAGPAGAEPAIRSSDCAATGARLRCAVTFLARPGVSATRHLEFERLGNLWRLVAAAPVD